MAQETTALQTQNSAGSTPGFLSSLGNFVKDLVPAATDIYKLQLQGKVLSQQYAGDIAASNAAQQQAYAAQYAAQQRQRNWLLWGGVALVVAVVVGVILRRR